MDQLLYFAAQMIIVRGKIAVLYEYMIHTCV